ncbi:MAG: DUF1761 domain-containing protein [Rhodospirillaceae bacterium]
MDAIVTDLNWPAVGLGVAVSFLLGWGWYSPKMFGRLWAAGVGVELASADKMPVFAMVVQLAGTILLSWVIGIAVNVSLTLVVLVVATILCLMVASGYYCQKSRQAVAIEAGFVVAMAVIMIAAQVSI